MGNSENLESHQKRSTSLCVSTYTELTLFGRFDVNGIFGQGI